MYSTNKRRFNELSIESSINDSIDDSIDDNSTNNSELDYSESYIKIGNKRRKISSLYNSLLKKDI